MLRFYYNPAYKYTNRTIVDVSNETSYEDRDYANIDSPDTINGHLIYQLAQNETIPTYIVDLESGKRFYVSGITQLASRKKYQISVIRDIISEAPNVWNKEQAYINAGTATDYCKYKKWDLPFTNTKVGSQRLALNGKSSFFVFYVNERDVNGQSVTENDFTIDYTTLPASTSYDVELDNLNEIPNFDFVGAGQIRSWKNLKGMLSISRNGISLDGTPRRLNITYDNQNYVNNYNLYINEASGSSYINHTLLTKSTVYPTVGPTEWYSFYQNNTYDVINDTSTSMNSFLTTYRASLGPSETQTDIDALDAYVDKIIKVPNALDPTLFDFYKITRERQTIEHNDFLTNSQTSTLTTLLSTNAYIVADETQNVDNGHFYFRSTEVLSTYTLQSLGTATTFTYTFKADTRKLPKSAVRCVNIVSDNTVGDQLIMQTLMLSQSNPDVDSVDGSDANIGRIIDIQYLPFSVATSTNANFTVGNHNLVAEFLDNDDFIYTTTLPTLENINKETDSIMIVSPSRKSQFKFSPYNNDGLMIFNSKITIRPSQSIIYIRPTTQGLLLQDWDDKDCLIIQEDFSLTTVNSAWTNYVYNNRNYQNAFNLQIQTKEFERGWERRIEQEQAKSDEWTARNISAQKAQTYTGNLPIISSVAGALGTAWKDNEYMQMAALDREYNEALYQKSLEVAKTQFSYQIENVKSQPLIPNTITAIDCKMLDGVYLEFYSTNTTELDSIANFYNYNGNRIDNYGTFETYWGPFVRGKIIISANYTQPEIDELNRRLELGIFTGGA